MQEPTEAKPQRSSTTGAPTPWASNTSDRRSVFTTLKVKEGELLDSWLGHPSYPVAQECNESFPPLAEQLAKAKEDGYALLGSVNIQSSEWCPAPVLSSSAFVIGSADEQGSTRLLPLIDATGPSDFKSNQVLMVLDVPLENLGLRLKSSLPVHMYESVACPECRHHLGYARTAADFMVTVSLNLKKPA